MRPESITARPTPETLIVGRIVAPHGVRGELRVEPLTDDARRFSSLSTVLVDGSEHSVLLVRRKDPLLLLRLSGIDTPEEARLLNGKYLRIRAEEALPLEEGAYFHYQLVGLEVLTTDGQSLGRVEEVIPREANDVYRVRGERGEVLVPAIRDVVQEIDLESRRIVVEALPGLLPWEAETA